MKTVKLLAALIALALLLAPAAVAEAEEPAFEITLPASYETSGQRYPALYVLPEDGFAPDASGLAEQLAAAMAAGEGAEMIIVRPALAEGTDPLAALAAAVEAVDGAYRTVPEPAFRAAVGTGTGGYLAYAALLGADSPFGAAASIRGDFASAANPWLAACGSVRDRLEALHRADAKANEAFYTYMDAPVEDEWTDMPGSTDDLGALFIRWGTGSAFHEFTVRPGVFDEAFLAESARRALNRLTARMFSGVISGRLSLSKTALTAEDEDFLAIYDIALSEKAAAFLEGEIPVEIRVSLAEDGAETAVMTASLTTTELAGGTMQMPNAGRAASATVGLTAKLFGASFRLDSAELIRVQSPVIEGDRQSLDLMGDWHFHYAGPRAALDAAALTPETFGSWPVVQPGLGSWEKGFGDISEQNVRAPAPDTFGFFIVGNGYYARTFTVPEGFDAPELVLSVGYVDDRCEVFVNGERVGATGLDAGGKPTGETTWAVFSHFAVDPALLQIGGENTVVVRAWNDLPYGAGGWYGGPIGLYSRAAFDEAFGEKDNPRFYEESYLSERRAAALGVSEPQEEKYLIYLPESYHTSDRCYPTVYLLHQFNSDHTSYRTDGVDRLLDEAIRGGLLDDVIVVMPNSSEESWWRGEWERLVTDELIPLIDSKYRTIDDPRFRLTAGCSMGGQGAYGLALRHPERFSGAVSFFGAFSYGGASSPNAIAAAESGDYLRGFALYFICGNQDNYGFGEPAIRLHQQLKALGVPHGFFIENGAHDSAFYLPHFIEGLAYVRAHMFHADTAAEDLLTGALETENRACRVTVTARPEAAALLPELPASSYTPDAEPALDVPVLFEITRDGETLFTAAVRGVRLTAGSLTGEAVLEVPEDVNLTRPATVTAKAALFDRTVELASAELKAD